MMARRIPSILPDLNFEEALEITKIHSIAGELPKNKPIITTKVSDYEEIEGCQNRDSGNPYYTNCIIGNF